MNDMTDATQSLNALVGSRQNNRLLRMSFPDNDGPDALMVANRLDAHEGLFRDFHFAVEILSDDADIQLKDMIGKNVTIELVREDGSMRYFNGHVFEFRFIKTDGGHAYYDMVLLPWLAFLRLRKDNYIFHGKTVEEQTKEIFNDYDHRTRDWDTYLLGQDPVMTDATQFDETDYNYLHRRWAARGWHYWYEHRKDGHTLVLSGNSTMCKPIDGKSSDIPWQDEAGPQGDAGISQLTPVRVMASTAVTAASFDFKSPRPERSTISTVNQQGFTPSMEIYEYAGAYGFKNQLAGGDAHVRQRMEEIEAAAKHFEASGDKRTVQPGRWYRLTGYLDTNRLGTADDDLEFLIIDATHTVTNNYDIARGAAPAEYKNTLTCLRKKIHWRPGSDFNCTEPKIYGLQTVTIVGPAGSEIHTDEYGRARVQFHWDRVGEFNEKSSAWVRVSTQWAGSKFGVASLPRIGQEWIVQFLDGNPDRPVLTGAVYNAANMPPWDLPANKTQSGILSRSTPGGNYDNANALRFEDKKGQEQLWLHAEKDQLTEVENDEDKWVGRDRRKTVDRDETVLVKHDRTETVDNNETVTVHNDRSERVDHNETISVGDNRTEDVGQNETISVGANRSVSVGANEDISIGSSQSVSVALTQTETVGLAKALSVGAGLAVTVGGAMNTAVGLAQFEEVGLNKSIFVGKKFSITAGEEFEVTVGKSHLVMKSDGTVNITGVRINIEGSGPVQISGKDVDIN